MEEDFRKEARKQYLHYFRFWFIGIGILAVACIAMKFVDQARSNVPRTNTDAPAERVYDYADVLTDQEEEKLREYIDKTEKKHSDIFAGQIAIGQKPSAIFLSLQCFAK